MKKMMRRAFPLLRRFSTAAFDGEERFFILQYRLKQSTAKSTDLAQSDILLGASKENGDQIMLFKSPNESAPYDFVKKLGSVEYYSIEEIELKSQDEKKELAKSYKDIAK